MKRIKLEINNVVDRHNILIAFSNAGYKVEEIDEWDECIPKRCSYFIIFTITEKEMI